jgi:two-component system chemotaxis response regulator CheY
MSKRILIVDDSPSVRQMVEVTLRSADYEVTAAEDGQVALTLCQTESFDFVLTDQNMPNMDGLSLIKALRSEPKYADIPIVMLTTEASHNMKEQGRSVGATGWMVKPFDPNKLLMVAQKVFARA